MSDWPASCRHSDIFSYKARRKAEFWQSNYKPPMHTSLAGHLMYSAAIAIPVSGIVTLLQHRPGVHKGKTIQNLTTPNSIKSGHRQTCACGLIPVAAGGQGSNELPATAPSRCSQN
eukprot:1146667-Pelagomonas_calceolata.AAC.2